MADEEACPTDAGAGTEPAAEHDSAAAMDAPTYEALLARCVEALDREDEAAVAAICAAHPQHAAELRRTVGMLRTFGLTGTTARLSEPLPERLGDFELVREIGRGGMGVVFEARQATPQRTVALKVLPTAWVRELRQVTRFRNEARAASALDHPHIVRVVAVGEDDGTHFFAMHWVDGVSVRRILNVVRGATPEDPEARAILAGFAPIAAAAPPGDARPPAAWFRHAASLALQAANGLAAAHAEGILHRDVKPGNLLVDRSGHLWVTDFGLAFFARAPSELTYPGEFVGTLAYSSPEQVSGRTLVDARSDVYALGATLYELLSLRAPFAATDHAALVRMIAETDAVSLRTRDHRIQPDLDTIVARCLAKEPSTRYQTAADVAADLRAFLDGRPIRARRITRLQRLWLACQRSPRRAAATLAIAVLLTIVAGVSWSAVRALRAEHALATLSSRHLVDSRRGTAEALRRSLTAGRRTASLRQLADATTELDRATTSAAERAALAMRLRSDVLASSGLWDATTEPLPELANDDAVIQCFDPTGSRFAARTTDGLLVRDAAGGTTTTIACADVVRAHVFSPDGAWLMLETRSGMRMWHIETGDVLAAPWPDRPHAWCFDHANRRFLACIGTNHLVAFDLTHRAWRESAEDSIAATIAACSQVNALAFSPDDRRIALFAHADQQLWIVDLFEGGTARRVDLPDHPLALAWSPDGEQLVVGGRFQDLLTVDVGTTRITQRWAGHHAEVVVVNWSHGGELIASSGWDGQILVWDRRGHPLVSLSVPVVSLQLPFGTDDDLVGWSLVDGDARRPMRWRLLPPAVLQKIPLGERPYSAFPWATFHPTAPLLAVSTLRSIVFIDRERGTVLGELPSPTPRRLRFLSDGSLCVASAEDGTCSIVPLELRGDELRVGPSPPIDPATLTVREADVHGAVRYVWDGAALHRLGSDGVSSRTVPLQFDHGVHLRVSADGRHAALGTFRGQSVAVWDLHEQRRVFETSVPQRSANVAFSPDCTRFVVCRCDEHQVFEVGSWRLLRTIPRTRRDALAGYPAFSPDGRLLALPATRSRLQVCDGSTFEPLFEVDVPDGGDLSEPAFDAAGTELALVSAHHAAYVWDLRAARHALRPLGLDWSDAPIPTRAAPRGPLRMVVVH